MINFSKIRLGHEEYWQAFYKLGARGAHQLMELRTSSGKIHYTPTLHRLFTFARSRVRQDLRSLNEPMRLSKKALDMRPKVRAKLRRGV